MRGVLLDVDDTLLDTRTAMQAAAASAMVAAWPRVTPDDAVRLAALFYDDPQGHFRAYTRGESTFEQMRHRRLSVAASAMDLPEPATSSLDRYESTFRPAFEQAQRMFDDALPFVAACRAAGLAVGALTNSSTEMTVGKFAALGVSDLFQVLVTRDTLGFGKPDPAVFEHACSLLGTAPAETIYVGDEYDVDVVGAAAAGLTPVWLRRRDQADAWGAGEALHAHAVRSLADLHPILGLGSG